VHIAQSLIREGNVDLDEYAVRGLIGPGDYRVREIGGHVHSYFPIGTPLLAAIPLALSRVLGFSVGLGPGALTTQFEMWLASFYVSLCVAVIYGIARVRLGRGKSFLVACVFAFCTSAWSTASRALWAQGPSMLMLSLTLYIALLAEKRPGWIRFASMPLAFSYVVRPTNSVSVVCFSAFVLLRHRKHLLEYLALSLPVAVPFFLFNWFAFGSPLSPYYMPGRLGTNPDFFLALAGSLISPARGLLVYSPVFIGSVVGVVLRVRERTLDKLDITLLSICALHLAVIAGFFHWWGGHSFGPRLLCNLVPYLTYLLVEVVDRLSFANGWADVARATCFVALVAFSAFVNGRGALVQATGGWNREPVNVDQHPERIWDWSDPQFARGLTPYVVAKPDRVYVIRHADDPGERRAQIELVNLADKPVRWQGSAPPGIGVTPAEGQGATRFALEVRVPERNDSPGRHSLGELEIEVESDGRLGWPRGSFAVPIEVYVSEGDHRLFFPLMFNGGRP
jgi:hypothetical protein